MSMYRATVPVFLQFLGSLDRLLDKAAAHASATGLDEAALLDKRLHADMYPLSRQVQLSSDFAKGTGARLAGVDNPAMPDVEASLAELKTRIARTVAFLNELRPEQINGSEMREISIKLRDRTLNFTGQDYLFHIALPQFFFHVTTAYGILRHIGADIGKRDYMGRIPGA